MILELILSLLILVGAGFTFIGSLGLLRLRDFYSRPHAPTKATTLGVGSLLVASAVFFSHQEDGISLHEVLVTLFLFITAPVGAHLMAKAALHLRLGSLAESPSDGLLEGEACQPAREPGAALEPGGLASTVKTASDPAGK